MKLDINLPKWPAMVVTGKKVTKEQAMEILIRTCSLSYICTNDREFKRKLYEYVYGVKSTGEEYSLYDYFPKDFAAEEKARTSMHERTKNFADELGYLKNSRIVSSWIGGPHGWCDWEGNIFCNTYNIGKHPSDEEVLADWILIAEAFPYLNLECQLFNGETCEENITPLIQYSVRHGKVISFIPTKSIHPVGDTNFDFNRSERGCTFEQFKTAYYYVTSKYSQNNNVDMDRVEIVLPSNNIKI